MCQNLHHGHSILGGGWLSPHKDNQCQAELSYAGTPLKRDEREGAHEECARRGEVAGLWAGAILIVAGPHEHCPHAQSPCESQEGGTVCTGEKAMEFLLNHSTA